MSRKVESEIYIFSTNLQLVDSKGAILMFKKKVLYYIYIYIYIYIYCMHTIIIIMVPFYY